MVGTDASTWLYIEAGAAIAQYDVVAVTELYVGVPITKALVDTGELVAIAPQAITNGEYAWVQLTGTCTINVLASAAANVILFSTATAGSLDDASTGQTRVDGLKLTAARGGTAGSAAGLASYPKSFVI
tara:strand:+ start:381 stop:767 length:387 start_codon:yes stop_codon:yes gene_type:complete